MPLLIILGVIGFISLVAYFVRKKFLSYEENEIESMYIHIPFCNHICSYCDFTKFHYNQDFVNRYVEALFYEIYKNPPSKVKTIFIGGGTPSSLDYENLEKVLSKLKNYLKIDGEFSIEVNPESIDEEKVKLFAKYGINRVSIGVQTFNENMLKVLNRKHSKEDVINCVELLNKYGISNYSFDFIYGISGQSISDIKKDIEFALTLNPKHFSFYSLTIEKHTNLYINKYPRLEDETVREMYDYIYKTLKDNNYNRYEVSNFCLEGYESRHNLTYWNNKEYYAYGVGSSSYVDGSRYKMSANLKAYMNKEFKKEETKVSKEDLEFEYLMLKLRLDKGFNLLDYRNNFGEDFETKYKKEIEKLIEEKLVLIDDDNFKTTYEGMMLLDHVFLNLVGDK